MISRAFHDTWSLVMFLKFSNRARLLLVQVQMRSHKIFFFLTIKSLVARATSWPLTLSPGTTILFGQMGNNAFQRNKE